MRIPTEGSASMYKTMEEHKGILEDHEDRLKKLEDQSLKLENTILTENRDTRNTMKEQTEKLFNIVESAMGYQTNKSTQDHELKMLKWNTFSTVFLKVSGGLGALFSAGGLIYYLITKFL
ncbi:hypothetical protein [Lysinibacillus sp. 3P01SB]|uniref:hypothetical protein n=1 Tax=Lysinibacillus sp. 3P01SB TaxID=3132284 RepID=UPI0039A58F8B